MSNTENRSSNTEMVSDLLPCPFCGEKPQITKHHREDIYSFMHRCQVLGPISWGFREDQQAHIEKWNARAKPAEQHQGEPVVLPARKREFTDSGTALLQNLSWNACLDEIAKLGPLYTHADPGEVGRLRGIIRMHEKTVQEQADHLAYMRAQLAERDALLREWLELHRRQQQPVTLHERTEAALSASAEPTARELHALQIEKSLGIERLPVEPSAPVIHPINMKTMMQAYEQVDHKAMLHGTSNWCAAMATALRGTLHSETSAPVEPLYQKCTVLKDAEVRYSNSTAPVERDERAAYEAWHLSRGDCSGMSIHAWQAWQARAALERKS